MNETINIPLQVLGDKPRAAAVIGNYWREGNWWYVMGARAILRFKSKATARAIASSILNPGKSEGRA